MLAEVDPVEITPIYLSSGHGKPWASAPVGPACRPRSAVVALTTLATLLGGGCISSERLEQHQLPPGWIAAVPKPDSPRLSLAGTYVDLGEKLDEHFARKGTVAREKLSTVLAPVSPTARDARRPSPPGTVTELRAIDATHFEVIVRIEGEVLQRHTHDVEFDPATGTTVLRIAETHAGPALLAAAAGKRTLRLWRAADGRLYLQRTTRAIGEMMLVPFFVSTEVWCRWEAAPSAAAAP